MSKQAIRETYSRAAREKDPSLCCSVDYRDHFSAQEIDHLPPRVIDRNYGCGVPAELKSLEEGLSVLDLGPGLGRDCFIASRKVGAGGKVYGLDMNSDMLAQATSIKSQVVSSLGFDNVEFLEGQFDVKIPLPAETIDVIFSNCVNNLATDKATAYREMFRVLKPGRKISFSDVVSYDPIPEPVRQNEQAWADCVAGVLSYQELHQILSETGFDGIQLVTDYLWLKGEQVLQRYFNSSQDALSTTHRREIESVRLYSVMVEAYKPLVDPAGECFFKGQFAIYHGPGAALHLDQDPDHVFPNGQMKEVCEKTATILKGQPFSRHFTVFEPEGDVEARRCDPDQGCC